MGLIVFLAVLALPVCWAIGAYKRLVALRNAFRTAYAHVDVQLKRRHDLIPGLTDSVKATMPHESDTLEAVVVARNSASAARIAAATDPQDARAITQMTNAESALSAALTRFIALTESYPGVATTAAVAQLLQELAGAEEQLSFARQSFNAAVTNHNAAIEQFPAKFVAGTFQFKPAEPLRIIESPIERLASKVKSS